MREGWIVLAAASSTVSNIVGAIGKERGINTIGLVRGDEALAKSRSMVDFVLSVSRPTLTKDIIQITGDHGVNALLDSVGGPLVARLLGTLVQGGRVIAYGVQDPDPIPVTNAMLIYSNLIWEGFGIDRWLSGQERPEIFVMFDELWSMVRRGTCKLRVDSTYRLQKFQKALKLNSSKERSGKVILVSP